MFYVQCRLVNQNRIDVRWIPEKLAEEGKQLIVKKEDGTKENGWVVEKAYGKTHEDNIVEMRDRYKHHRKGTDI